MQAPTLSRIWIWIITALFCLASSAWSQQIHRFPFETRTPAFVKGTADVPFRELVHDVTDATAHNGQFCEHIQVLCEQGTFIYYYYPTPRAPLADELTVRVFVKANRPGAQLMARLVLPKERNPNQLDEPMTAILRGDVYQSVSRWQPLELRRPTQLARQQQQVLRNQLGHDVDFTDAYIDRLILNVFSGPNMTEVWIDDLDIGPVVEDKPFRTTGQPGNPVKLVAPSDSSSPPVRTILVEMERGNLKVNRQRFFFKGIRHSDTPLNVLRESGCNTVWLDVAASQALIDEAATLGFLVVPSLPVQEDDARLTSAENLRNEISRFLERDNILFWDLGGGLTDEQSARVTKTASLVRALDPQRPVGADAWDGFGPYSYKLDLLGAHRWPLMTGLGLAQYRQWLNQRRLLGDTTIFTWTWVQTHLPDWYTTLVYSRRGSDSFSEPIGPQPEQIRLLTYLALSTGCRGIGYWSDRFLADSHQGRDRLLTIALLNNEMRMLEKLLMTAERPGVDESSWVNTSLPEVKAAVLRTEHGTLVLPIWIGQGSQFVPGQAAAANLSLTIPQVPLGTQVWQISPGHIRCLTAERIVGGTRVVIPEFGLTTALLFTTEIGQKGIIAELQDQERQNGRITAQWAIELGEEEIAKVAKIHEQLVSKGHSVPGSEKLLEDAKARLKTAAKHWENRDYREAHAEAERALRPLRIMMRSEWEAAVVGKLDAAICSPYAVSYYTLPKHWPFMEQFSQGLSGPNVLPHGDFESTPDRGQDAWLAQETTLDDVTMTASRVADGPHDGKFCLKLQIAPKKTDVLAPSALERTFLAINSPTVHLPPGTPVKISGWARVPKTIAASVDGALLYDSAGGEPLAIRLVDPIPWKQFTLYRQVPASGMINVTLALTGIGTVYFDDVKIEPMQQRTAGAATTQGALTSRSK